MSDRWHCRFSKADACEKKWAGAVDAQQIVPSCRCAVRNERLSMFLGLALTNNIRVTCADPYGSDFKRSRLVWQSKHGGGGWCFLSFLWFGIHATRRLEEGYRLNVTCPWTRRLSRILQMCTLICTRHFFKSAHSSHARTLVCSAKKVFPRCHGSD